MILVKSTNDSLENQKLIKELSAKFDDQTLIAKL